MTTKADKRLEHWLPERIAADPEALANFRFRVGLVIGDAYEAGLAAERKRIAQVLQFETDAGNISLSTSARLLLVLAEG